MTRSRPITFLATAAAIPLSAVALAACGGGGSAATAAESPSSAQAKPATTHTATLRVANSRLGRILVNSQGRTLYLFKADSNMKSACSGACATAWPPLLAKGKPIGGKGLIASKLGTIKRSGGSRQVTYNGHPLYLFIKDTRPGQVNGQGLTAFGAAWFAVSPAGNQVPSKPSRHAARPSSSPAAPAPPPVAKPKAAPKPTPQPPAPPAAKPAPPVAQPPAPANGIPQNNGGDGDADNNGGPSDGDGNI